MFVDEGVYVNNSGSLVKHAVMQWGETPYAVGKAFLFHNFRINMSSIIEYVITGHL